MPKNPEKWRYELALCVDDPDVKGIERPQDLPKIKTFEQGEPVEGPWRCNACYYKRFKTNVFGMNEGGDICQHCLKNKLECGWTLWVKYDDLPDEQKKYVRIRYGAKILEVLDIKWPNCRVEILDREESPSI